MYIRKCNGCGHYIHENVRGPKCPNCGELLDAVICYRCGRMVSGAERVPKRAECKKCHNEVDIIHRANSRQRRRDKLQQRLDDWQLKIRKIPRSYHTLTEAEWLEACNYFGGCAICGCPDVDTRALFMPLIWGGRYCKWNVIPECQICSKHFSNLDNAFSASMHRDYSLRSKQYRTCLEKIVEYLEPLVDEAIEETQNE